MALPRATDDGSGGVSMEDTGVAPPERAIGNNPRADEITSHRLYLWALKRKFRFDPAPVISLMKIEREGDEENFTSSSEESWLRSDHFSYDDADVGRSDADDPLTILKTPVKDNQMRFFSAEAAYYYARRLSTAYRYTAKGLVPPSSLLRSVAELLRADQARKLIRSYPRLADLLTTKNEGEGRTLEKKKYGRQARRGLRRRLELLNAIKDKQGASFDRLLYFPSGIKERAEWEIRMLRLRRFQEAVRQRVLSEMKGSAEAGITELNQFFLSQGPDGCRREEPTQKAVPSAEIVMEPNNLAACCYAGAVLPPLVQKVSFQCEKKLRQPPTCHQMLRTKLDRLLEDLPLMYRTLRKRWETAKGKWKIAGHETCKRIEAISARREAIRERERKQRMRLLKEKDFVKYLELVQQSKNARIEELITQTDKFLQTVTSRVLVEQLATVKSKQAQQRAVSEAGRDTGEAIPSKQKAAGEIAVSRRRSSSRGLEEGEDYLYQHVLGEAGQRVAQPKSLLGGTLMPYQLTGLQFLVSLFSANLSGILADEMGLGKTIQAISLLAYLKECENIEGPHLIIVPLSTLPNWVAEFEKWCPTLSVVQFRGNKQERRELAHVVKRSMCNVCVTTYDWVIREKGILSTPHWTYIIVDEGHRMKNVRSKFHVTLAEFRSTHRLLLTGTPLQNNLTELWSLLNFLLPKIFTSVVDFEHWFEEPFKDLQGQETELTEEEKFLIINRLHCVLRPFLLRRIKSDVLDDLPEKREYTVRVQLSAWQQRAYEQLSKRVLRIQNTEGNISSRCFANVMMQLRKIVNHPYLFEDEYFVNENLYRVSGKFEVLDRMLPKLLHFGHKVLIFCQMTQLMDILDDYLELRNYKRARLDGSTSLEDRRDRMEQFNNANSDTFIFVLSTRAGGLGLNLQAADTVIIFDSDWNPHQDLQAQARAHRVGQKSEVRVFRLVTVSGVEEAILSKAQHKLDIDEKIIQAGMFNNRVTDEEREKKLRMLLCSKDMRRESRVTTPQELNHFMARSEEEEEYFQSFDDQLFGAETFRKFEEQCDLKRPLASSTTPDDDDDDVELLEAVAPRPKRRARRRRKVVPGSISAINKTGLEIVVDQERNDLVTPVTTRRTCRSLAVAVPRGASSLSSSAESVTESETTRHESQPRDGFMTEEAFLIQCDRLMSLDELPIDWILNEENEATVETKTELSRHSRRSRSSSRTGPDPGTRRENGSSFESPFMRPLNAYTNKRNGQEQPEENIVEKPRRETRRSHRESTTSSSQQNWKGVQEECSTGHSGLKSSPQPEALAATEAAAVEIAPATKRTRVIRPEQDVKARGKRKAVTDDEQEALEGRTIKRACQRKVNDAPLKPIRKPRGASMPSTRRANTRTVRAKK